MYVYTYNRDRELRPRGGVEWVVSRARHRGEHRFGCVGYFDPFNIVSGELRINWLDTFSQSGTVHSEEVKERPPASNCAPALERIQSEQGDEHQRVVERVLRGR